MTGVKMREEIVEKVRDDNGWRSMVQRAALDCPCCNQTWLIIGVDKSHPYTCKACGYSFRIEAKKPAMKKAARG
jgi:transposase-like protein